MAIWPLVYFAVFYIVFRFDPRFLTPLIPLLAIVGGYTIDRAWNRSAAAFIIIVLLIPFCGAVRLSYLATQSDTRERAREWVLQNLSPSDKVLVYSSALHIPTQKAAVEELRSIDPRALRKVDEADEIIDSNAVPYVLNNLTSLIGEPMMNNLPQYVSAHQYEYLVLEPRSLPGAGTTTAEALASVTKDAHVVARFDGFDYSMSIWESSFLRPLPVLFDPKLLGPEILIYRLE
jgi:hypothetical protein